MKAKLSKYAVIASLLALAYLTQRAFATPYFRLVGDAPIEQNAGVIFSTSKINDSVGVTDFALITHSGADGSIIPEAWRSWLSPEDWTLLQLGGGGSFSGTAVVNVGASANVMPQLGGFLSRVCSQSAASACLVAESVLNSHYASSGLSFAAGPSWYAEAVQDGTLLPIDKWPGRLGLFTGAAWKFGGN